ncbi:SRPBCC family protein [Alicyclobacillus ferrooxydans]|uniref:SRPBCC family protein n=1 Tax=Alicyclobacillus ferrooxydans TaxID=471514 RepID=UPI000AA6D3EE
MQDTLLPEIRKTVVINAPGEKVWQAISTSEGIAGWWMENTFEPIPGHEFILRAGPYGDSRCRVTEFEPMHKIRFDWDTDWQLTFQLAALDNSQTEFTLIHSGFDEKKSTLFGQQHTAVREIMDGGWEKIVKEKLPSYVDSQTR